MLLRRVWKVSRTPRKRPVIAFFDYPDVYEDFYPHYGVDQRVFATRWADTGTHAFLELLQREVGDVIWYMFSLAPEISETKHETIGCIIRMFRSSWAHRILWRAFYLPRFAWRWRGAYRPFATIASYLAPLSRKSMATLLRDRPDYIFSQDYCSGKFDVLFVISRLLGVPLIAYHAGSTPDRYLGRIAKKWTIPRTDLFIASGQGEFEMLTRRYGVSPERIQIILTPIDTARFRPMDRRGSCSALALDADRRYLLFVGRLDDHFKRVSALIRTLAGLTDFCSDVELLVVGDGRDREKLQKLANELIPNQVHFLGWISEKLKLAQLYNVAECLVLPSLREGFPTVVGEAMACGTPVVASRVGGVGELVLDGESGWLVEPGDDAALANCLSFLLTQPSALLTMRTKARRLAEQRVSHSAVVGMLRACFRSGCEKHVP